MPRTPNASRSSEAAAHFAKRLECGAFRRFPNLIEVTAEEKRGDAAHSKRFAQFGGGGLLRDEFGVRRLPPLSETGRCRRRGKARACRALQTLRAVRMWRPTSRSSDVAAYFATSLECGAFRRFPKLADVAAEEKRGHAAHSKRFAQFGCGGLCREAF